MSYTGQAQTALRMLARSGVTLTLSRVVKGTRDIVAQSASGTAPSSQLVQVAIFPATTSRDQTIDERTAVRKNQRLLYIAGLKPDGSALDFAPDDQQVIVFENATWTIGGVSVLSPDDSGPVLFTADARR